MTKHWRHGGILAEFREDGTLHIYAPDDSRVISSDLAADLVGFLAEALDLQLTRVVSLDEIFDSLDTPDEAPALEAAFAQPCQFEQVPEVPEPSFQDLRDACKAFGLPANGNKVELQARLDAADVKRGDSSD